MYICIFTKVVIIIFIGYFYFYHASFDPFISLDWSLPFNFCAIHFTSWAYEMGHHTSSTFIFDLTRNLFICLRDTIFVFCFIIRCIKFIDMIFHKSVYIGLTNEVVKNICNHTEKFSVITKIFHHELVVSISFCCLEPRAMNKNGRSEWASWRSLGYSESTSRKYPRFSSSGTS